VARLVDLLNVCLVAESWAEVLLPPAANDDEKGRKFPLLVHA